MVASATKMSTASQLSGGGSWIFLHKFFLCYQGYGSQATNDLWKKFLDIRADGKQHLKSLQAWTHKRRHHISLSGWAVQKAKSYERVKSGYACIPSPMVSRDTPSKASRQKLIQSHNLRFAESPANISRSLDCLKKIERSLSDEFRAGWAMSIKKFWLSAQRKENDGMLVFLFLGT